MWCWHREWVDVFERYREKESLTVYDLIFLFLYNIHEFIFFQLHEDVRGKTKVGLLQHINMRLNSLILPRLTCQRHELSTTSFFLLIQISWQKQRKGVHDITHLSEPLLECSLHALFTLFRLDKLIEIIFEFLSFQVWLSSSLIFLARYFHNESSNSLKHIQYNKCLSIILGHFFVAYQLLFVHSVHHHFCLLESTSNISQAIA